MARTHGGKHRIARTVKRARTGIVVARHRVYVNIEGHEKVRATKRRLTHWMLDIPSYLLSRFTPLSAFWFFLTRFHKKITITYISKDAPVLLAIAYAYYKRLGITVRVFLDDQSSQSSLEYLEARDIPFDLVVNPKDYVEPLYKEVSALLDTQWMLIITNDELLNVHSLIEISLRVHLNRDIDCFGISRAWIMLHEGMACVARADFMGPDYQYRLIRHRNVTFHDQIHTPGFDVPEKTAFLTEASCLYHFDWILRSRDHRQSKLDFYETKLPGASDTYRKWYLPEDFAEDFELHKMSDQAVVGAVSEYKELAGAT